MRRRWSELTKANSNFESAISSCPEGPRELDCDKQDWQRSEEDFENAFGSRAESSYDDSSSDCQVVKNSEIRR